jgi:hypothetical protein
MMCGFGLSAWGELPCLAETRGEDAARLRHVRIHQTRSASASAGRVGIAAASTSAALKAASPEMSVRGSVMVHSSAARMLRPESIPATVRPWPKPQSSSCTTAASSERTRSRVCSLVSPSTRKLRTGSM